MTGKEALIAFVVIGSMMLVAALSLLNVGLEDLFR